MSLWDRLLLRRAAACFVLILLATFLLVGGLELVLEFNSLTGGELSENESRTALLLQYFLARLPQIAGPILTLSAMGATLLALAPRLRNRELIALGASGLDLKRLARPLLLLAIAVGLLQILLADQIDPRLEGPRTALHDQLSGDSRSGRSRRIGATAWYVHRVDLRTTPPRLEKVVAACDDGRLLLADHLRWGDSGWELHGQIVDWNPAREPERLLHRQLACRGQLAIPHQPRELVELLVSRYSMTSGQLLASGDRISRAFVYRRWAGGLAPLLAVMVVLAIFLRYTNADRIMSASLSALLLGAVPPGLLGIGNLALEASLLAPELAVALSIIVATLPAVWIWRRWQT